LRVDGSTIATSKADLTDSALTVPIVLTEWGATHDVAVWTATLATGATTSAACTSWTSGANNVGSAYGTSSRSDGFWTNTLGAAAGPTCDKPLSLYCFQDDCPGVPSVNFQSDPANCGACGKACVSGQRCMQGRCGGCVFVTSTQTSGSITVAGTPRGLPSADAMCNTQAVRGKLPGAYTAWLSTSTSSAASRLIDGAFFRTDGALVAPNLARLLGTTSTKLQNPISLDESGNPPQVIQVWTGTNPNGTANAANCTDWTGFPSSGGLGGLATAMDTQWTSVPAASCDISKALYCIETLSSLVP
jgi:hypothetical protein